MPIEPNRIQVTLYLPPELNISLKEIARVRDKKVSHLAVALLQEAVRRETKLAGTTYLMPEIDAMLEDKLSNMEKQFIRLLTRTAIENGATKRLVIRLFIALRITTADEINEMENEAWNEARNSLRKPLESLDELITSLRSREVK